MEDIDGFEPKPEGTVEEKKAFLLKFFQIEPVLKEPALSVAIAFKTIAQTTADLPEGTLRSSLLERLADSRSATMRALKDFRK